MEAAEEVAEEVAEVVPEFADAFPFEAFNEMQREAVPGVLHTDSNVVASAPTASGKTALAELAICKCLEAGGTALFVAPMRALTNEKESEWERFEDLGYSVYVVTGERDLNPRRAERADVLVMTPEKADSATRKHESPRYAFVREVDCCVIDEVHLLDSEKRGSVLEAVVSRLRRLCDPRFVALSATMPNVEDVAEWLDAPPETTYEFGDDYRPVELHAGVETYRTGENAFQDKYRRLYTALDLAEPHIREDGQALVFVSSRQDTVRAAEKARDVIAERDVPVGARGDYDFHQRTQELENQTLRQSVLDGVAFHHAGLSKADKDRVEAWFREGQIDLLFSTTTLAWGVNLPARCVVLRDTKLHDPLEGEVDISPLDVLQMLGRAGRPGYDDVGYGWVVAEPDEAGKYRRLLREGKRIESRLAEDLAEHLNAEIALGTLRGVEDVMGWLETTFYAVRAKRDPDAYPGDLRERARETLEGLVERGFVETDDDLGLSPTPLGKLASRFYLRLATAERFHAVADGEVTEERVLRAVARAAEFDSVSARQSETDAVDDLVAAPDLDPGERKVLAILRGRMDGSVPPELGSDAWVISQNARRLFAALAEATAEFGDAREENLVRRLDARVEHGVVDEAVGLTAIDGVSAGRAHALAEAGIETPGDVRDAGTEGLVAAGLGEAVAERVCEGAASLPDPRIEWGDFPEEIAAGTNQMCEIAVHNDGGGATAALRVTVHADRSDDADDGVEMTADRTYLNGETTLPVGVFGADAETLTFRVEVVFPGLPLRPVARERTVAVV
jgi:replicative superfamily II helicase